MAKLLDSAPSLQVAGQTVKSRSLDDPALFINREVSWIRFNYRVLEEAFDERHPLLERVKFLAISGSNLDEFFMTRASILEQHIERGEFEPTPGSRMTPQDQIKVTRSEILPLLKRQKECWETELAPALAKEGIHILNPSELNKQQSRILREYFQKEILPVMKKPDAEYVAEYISNLHVNLLVVANDPRMSEVTTKFLVEAPTDKFDRFVRVSPGENRPNEDNFILLEDLVGSNLDLLFPSAKILHHFKFRVTRNAEIEILADEKTDFLTTMELSIRQRHHGKPARLEFESTMPQHLREYLATNIGSFHVPNPEDVQYEIDSHFGLADFWHLLKLKRPDLKDTPFQGFIVPELGPPGSQIFGAMGEHDYALYHPYDSFDMVVNVLAEAAIDPTVTEIYITLYRIDPDSPVISHLMKAASSGKKVTALIELKAKFDEANNIRWAKLMTQAGVKVVYNFPKIKVHAKLALIVRKENGKTAHYSHLGSGNYNTVTTRIYGDIGYLTSNQKMSTELLDLFSHLTSDPRKAGPYKHLLVSPTSLKNEILNRINREIITHQNLKSGYLAFKMNGLVDKDIIQALYRASQAGVRIDLNVRGLCCLRPGIQGVSENIRVVSIVGRFLEHARIYYFRNGGEEEVLLGSSDMMPRNLEKRVEVLFLVPDPEVRSAILRILDVHLKDNVKARRLLPDGTYERIKPRPGEEILDSQVWLINNRGAWHEKTPNPEH